jgi:hypothetical protein
VTNGGPAIADDEAINIKELNNILKSFTWIANLLITATHFLAGQISGAI